MSSLSSNTIPSAPATDTSAPVSDPDQLQLQQDLKDILSQILEGQDQFYEYFHEKYDVELTEEEILSQEEETLHRQEYETDLLDTLHQIYAATVSQNGLLEENNRLLLNSLSMNSLETVSENTVSQNALLTTKLEDYSLTDSLLLGVFVVLLLFLLGNTFLRRGR